MLSWDAHTIIAFAIIFAIVATLWALSVILAREKVKTDLNHRVCQPVSIRWRPFYSTRLSCVFAVIYVDFSGQTHRADCSSPYLMGEIRWKNDRILGTTPQAGT